MSKAKKPEFTQEFRDYVNSGDSITCQIGGYEFTATLRFDYDAGAPDKETEGFWPSLNPSDAGYIGAKSKSTLGRERAKAQAVYDAWQRGDMIFCGVVISAAFEGVPLGDNLASLWGVNCNWEGYRTPRKRGTNAYLRDVANQLLPEAMAEAKRIAWAMRDKLTNA